MVQTVQTKEGIRIRWYGWVSNPVGGVRRSQVGSTPAAFRQSRPPTLFGTSCGHFRPFNAVSNKRCSNKAGRLHAFDKSCQIGRGSITAAFRNTHRLTNDHEALIQNAQPTRLTGVLLRFNWLTETYIRPYYQIPLMQSARGKRPVWCGKAIPGGFIT